MTSLSNSQPFHSIELNCHTDNTKSTHFCNQTQIHGIAFRLLCSRFVCKTSSFTVISSEWPLSAEIAEIQKESGTQQLQKGWLSLKSKRNNCFK